MKASFVPFTKKGAAPDKKGIKKPTCKDGCKKGC
jgi:hypothetical protein